jgi:molybdopterin-guanine dinucleotide biosynthesis protein A
MTSIILAGGKSSRFGWNKALETIGSKSLIQWVIDRLAKISTEIIIVTAQDETLPYSPSSMARSVTDIYPKKGPLGGIYTGLVASASLHAIVVGCDMPFLNTALLEYMAQLSSTFDAIVPRTQKGIERLCAVYSKNCLVPIHSLLERNELEVSKLFNMVKVKYVEEDEINRFDPKHLSFLNINTQTDLAKARKLAQHKRSREKDSSFSASF